MNFVRVTMLLASPHAYHFKRILSFGEGQEGAVAVCYHASPYLKLGLSDADFGKSELIARSTEILRAAFIKSIVSRPELQFLPMFNFIYKDSHSMLTMGGMIAGRTERRQLRTSSIGDTVYSRSNFTDPAFEIKVPRLTPKERIYLDREMPCEDDWVPGEFDLDPEVIRHYRDIYRFLPAFAEISL